MATEHVTIFTIVKNSSYFVAFIAGVEWLGFNPESWGADLRVACKSAVKVGSIPQRAWDETFGTESRWDRDYNQYQRRTQSTPCSDRGRLEETT